MDLEQPNKVTNISHDTSEYNDNTGMEEEYKWKMSPKIIISEVTYKTQDGNLANSRVNISTSGSHVFQFLEYYAGLNEILDVTDSVNPNSVSFRSADFPFLVNPNVSKKYRYIMIVFNMIGLPSKVILSANQVRVVVNSYENTPRKIGGEQRLITTNGRERRMLISDGVAYLPVR